MITVDLLERTAIALQQSAWWLATDAHRYQRSDYSRGDEQVIERSVLIQQEQAKASALAIEYLDMLHTAQAAVAKGMEPERAIYWHCT